MIQTGDKLRDKSKTRAVATQLRQAILSGSLRPGAAMPTAKKLSERHGIALTTASTAMSQLVHEGLVVRVPRRGSFVVERLPLMKHSDRREIDFIRIRMASGMHERASDLTMVEELSRLSSRAGWTARWHHFMPEEVLDIESVVGQFSDARGVIALKNAPVELVRMLHRNGVPAVAVNPPPTDQVHTPASYPQVVFDRVESSRLACEHLIALGRRRIAFFSTSGSPYSALRLMGLVEVVKQHHLTLNPQWCFSWSQNPVEDLRAQALAVFRGQDRPDAICCTAEAPALAAELVAREAGLRVPQDLAVIACDTVDPMLAVREAPVAITAVGPSIEEMCTEALNVIERSKPGRKPAADQLINPVIVPVLLIVRQSCGARLKGEKQAEIGEK